LDRLLRAAAALLLFANAAILARVLAGLAIGAPDWVALHYTPTRAEDRCEATITRLRAEIRQRRQAEPTAEDEAMFDRLRRDGRCEPGQLPAFDEGR
jgi:hypothetical protein